VVSKILTGMLMTSGAWKSYTLMPNSLMSSPRKWSKKAC